MITLFGSRKPVHPMADLKDAKKILEELPANDPLQCAEELSRWLESVAAVDGFKPDYRAQLVQLLDETGQSHLHAIELEYLVSPRLGKSQEISLWKTIYKYWLNAALAYNSCIDLFESRARGADALKDGLPLLLARALNALAAQVKWVYVRYGPVDPSVWGVIARIYVLAETHHFAQSPVRLYPDVPNETTPEQVFLRAVMLAASSPNSLLPLEMELCERLIAHVGAAFTLRRDLQPDNACWIDLAGSHGPLRLERLPQPSPSLRFVAAGKALQELGDLIATVKTTGVVPSQVYLGGEYPVATVLEVLDHLTLYWSPKSHERKHERHRAKSRLNVTHGYDGVLAALGYTSYCDTSSTETWIVENVSAGGFGAGIPELTGDWLKIGCLLGLQPEGGDNWVLGVIRRLNFENQLKASVGIQTLATAAQPVQLRINGDADGKAGLLISDGSEAPGEVRVLLQADAFDLGQNLEYQKGETTCPLVPQGVMERGEGYEVIKYREVARDIGH